MYVIAHAKTMTNSLLPYTTHVYNNDAYSRLGIDSVKSVNSGELYYSTRVSADNY